MRVLFILLLSLELWAFDSASASKIFDRIFHAMIQKEVITVYTSNKAYQKVIRNAKSLELSDDFKVADIILVNSFDEIPPLSENKLIFTTSYLVYKERENAVGAFYWKRGQIRIEFLQRRLTQMDVVLPESFQKYVKEKL